ncbi:MAG: SDR family NAD(P)-dependent oxidoreductase [Tumebacillaceae bacterium]
MTSTEKRPIAFITGTSSGMGLVTAVELAKEGYHVVATVRNVETKSGALLDAAQTAGVAEHIEVVALDVSDEQAVQHVIQGVYDKHGNIDVLVNNAGYGENGFIEERDIASFRRVFDTNFFGVVAACKAVIPKMRENRKGLIITIGSISAKLTAPGLASYCSSKAAVEAFSESLRFEMIPFNVHVALIHPGAFKTGIWAGGIADTQVDPTSPYAPGVERLNKAMINGAANSADPIAIAHKVVELAKTEYPEFRHLVPESLKDEYLIRTVTPTKRTEKPFIDIYQK